MEIAIRIVGPDRKNDAKLKNEPFPLRGRMIVNCGEGVWTHREELLPPEEVSEMCFPEEDYDYDEMSAGSSPCVFLGAYDGDDCVGLAVMQHHFLKYMYLYDLKVNREYRGKGVGRALIAKCCEVSREQGYRGVYTVGQDNNLNACLFYLANGFEIGGFDNRCYTGTSQEGKGDIYFYKENP